MLAPGKPCTTTQNARHSKNQEPIASTVATTSGPRREQHRRVGVEVVHAGARTAAAAAAAPRSRIAARATGSTDTTTRPATTSTAPAIRKRGSTSKLNTPTSASSSSATRSVTRSAMTIGRGRAIAMPCDARSSTALTASPSLPGRDRQREAGQEHLQRCPPSATRDAHLAQVVLPAQEAHGVVRRRQQAGVAARSAIRTRPAPCPPARRPPRSRSRHTPRPRRQRRRPVATRCASWPPSHNTPAPPRGGRWRTAPRAAGRRARLGAHGRHAGFTASSSSVTMRRDGPRHRPRRDCAAAAGLRDRSAAAAAGSPGRPERHRRVDHRARPLRQGRRARHRGRDRARQRRRGRDAGPGLRADPARRDPRPRGRRRSTAAR